MILFHVFVGNRSIRYQQPCMPFSFQGFIQIQLLPRLRYLLEVCEPDDVTVNYCMNILSRIALHSTELAYNIVECPRIMSTVVEAFLPVAWSLDGSRVNGFPCYRALRLIRFLCIAGKNLSSKLVSLYHLEHYST